MLHTPDNYQKRLKNNSLFFSWYSQLARWLWFGDSDEKNDLTEVLVFVRLSEKTMPLSASSIVA